MVYYSYTQRLFNFLLFTLSFCYYFFKMSQRKVLPYTTINELDASILELPYGKEDRLCMLLILPRRNATLAQVFENLRDFNIATINHELHKYDNTNDYDETEIELSLPRFKIESDLELRTVLEEVFFKLKAFNWSILLVWKNNFFLC